MTRIYVSLEVCCFKEKCIFGTRQRESRNRGEKNEGGLGERGKKRGEVLGFMRHEDQVNQI